jgi:hydrogenase/urease accessory protein HupE
MSEEDLRSKRSDGDEDRGRSRKRRKGHSRQLLLRLGSLLISASILVLVAAPAHSHPLAPALLELMEEPNGEVEVLWKRSSLSVPGSRIEPVVPPDCPALTQPRAEKQGVAVLLRWRIDCGEAGLVGRTVRVEGLGPAKIDTLVRIELADERKIQRVLRRGDPEMVVPEKASRWTVFVDYMNIGFDHILSGLDHLLFVFGLFLLCAGLKPLVKTVTAFTVGHSITLSLAALGYANLPSGPIEVLIAASVLVLAVELAREAPEPTLMRRYPWPMALGFGLLHGMGFAGALREVGLPTGEIPIALFSFNVGIELGQLVFVVALAALAPLARRLPIPLPQRTAVYVMGSMAAFWMIQRVVAI